MEHADDFVNTEFDFGKWLRSEIRNIIQEELAKREKEDSQLQFELNEVAQLRELWPWELSDGGMERPGQVIKPQKDAEK